MKAKILGGRSKIEGTIAYITHANKKDKTARFLDSNYVLKIDTRSNKSLADAFNYIKSVANYGRAEEYKNPFAHMVIAYAPSELPSEEEMKEHLRFILKEAGLDESTPYLAVVHEKEVKAKGIEKEGVHVHVIFPTFDQKGTPWYKPERFTNRSGKAYQNRQWATHDSAIMFQQICAEAELKFGLVKTLQAQYTARKVKGAKPAPDRNKGNSKKAESARKLELLKQSKPDKAPEKEKARRLYNSALEQAKTLDEFEQSTGCEKVYRREKLTAIKIEMGGYAFNFPIEPLQKQLAINQANHEKEKAKQEAERLEKHKQDNLKKLMDECLSNITFEQFVKHPKIKFTEDTKGNKILVVRETEYALNYNKVKELFEKTEPRRIEQQRIKAEQAKKEAAAKAAEEKRERIAAEQAQKAKQLEHQRIEAEQALQSREDEEARVRELTFAQVEQMEREQHEYDLEQHAQPKPVAPAVQVPQIKQEPKSPAKPKHSKIRI